MPTEITTCPAGYHWVIGSISQDTARVVVEDTNNLGEMTVGHIGRQGFVSIVDLIETCQSHERCQGDIGSCVLLQKRVNKI